ncbi:MAG: diaminopropionate ammonia-lyase [Candidatus Rokubacteria bacterium]|nr:diaminopropionate ammonia-lyase [Candidatus Rokubacteria bacterium]
MSVGSARVRFAPNPYYRADVPAALLPPLEDDPAAFHRSLPGYAPTPLVALPGLAAELGLGEVWLKDESRRFGLGAFKALGGSYAIHRLFARSRPSTVATATAGNHGRGVAWAGRLLGLRAVIFVPGHTVPARIEALRREGAEVVVVDGSYDDALSRAAEESAAHGWQVVSDTAYPGYTEIPRWILTAYTTLFAEAAAELAARGAGEPDLVFLQAGVGGLAWAGTFFYVRRAGRRRPRLVAVEPLEADGLLESIASPGGEMRTTRGRLRTIMAGLNAGTPSSVAWPLLRAAMDAFLAVDDGYAEEAMRRLHAGGEKDPRVVAGESGAAGLAGLLALCREPLLAATRQELGVGPGARVLLVASEGATDPASYRRIVGAEP